MKTLLVVSKGMIHPPYTARNMLKKLLDSMGEYDKTYISRFELLSELNLSEFSGIILYYHLKEKKNYAPSINKLIGYVKNGGGVLSLHGTTASFKGNETYSDMLGGVFTGHGRVSEFKVDGFVNFKIRDELYRHKFKGDYLTVLTGGNEPVYWKKNFGKGRVACLTLGHNKHIFTIHEGHRIIEDALKFIVTGE